MQCSLAWERDQAPRRWQVDQCRKRGGRCDWGTVLTLPGETMETTVSNLSKHERYCWRVSPTDVGVGLVSNTVCSSQ